MDLTCVQQKRGKRGHALHYQKPLVLKTQKHTHTQSIQVDGVRPFHLKFSLYFTSNPLWSFKILSLTVEGIGHITSSPPHRTEALHLTLEIVQASSTSGLRRGDRFWLRDEGQRTASSLHAEELCCFPDKRSFHGFTLFYLWLLEVNPFDISNFFNSIYKKYTYMLQLLACLWDVRDRRNVTWHWLLLLFHQVERWKCL